MKHDVDAVRREAEMTLRSVVPDLTNMSFYICDSHTAARGVCHYGESCDGFWGRHLTVANRDSLIASGRWRGPGVTIFVNDRSFAKRHPGPKAFRSRYLGVSAHELAHALVYDKFSSLAEDFDSTKYVEAFGKTADRFFYGNTAPDIRAVREKEDAPWRTHDMPFIRATIHLRHRLGQQGVCLSLTTDVQTAGRPYLLSDPAFYLSALRDELHDREDESIRSILASDPPEAFAELWREDTGEG